MKQLLLILVTTMVCILLFFTIVLFTSDGYSLGVFKGDQLYGPYSETGKSLRWKSPSEFVLKHYQNSPLTVGFWVDWEIPHQLPVGMGIWIPVNSDIRDIDVSLMYDWKNNHMCYTKDRRFICD